MPAVMPVARAPLRRGLSIISGITVVPPRPAPSSSSSSSVPRPRLFSSGASLRAAGNNTPRVHRFIPDSCRTFYLPNGHLLTTAANLDFMRNLDLTHDNGEIYKRRWTNSQKSFSSKIGVSLFFSPKHIISPFHLPFLDPRGHPLATQKRDQYKAKALNEPLWVIALCSSGPKSVVRHTIQNRLRAAVYSALEAKGYDRYGNSPTKVIRGTLWMHVRDPMSAVVAGAMGKYGEMVVSLLEEAQAWPATEETPEAPRGAGHRHRESGQRRTHHGDHMSRDSTRSRNHRRENHRG